MMKRKTHKTNRNRALRAFLQHKLGIAGLVVLIVFYVMIIFGEFFAPYDHTRTRQEYNYLPPTPVRWFHEGEFVGPFVYRAVEERNPVTLALEFSEDTSTPYRIRFFPRGYEYRLLGFIPADRHLIGIESDEAVMYLLGGDKFGRDLLSKIIIGGRVSLTAGLIGTAISVLLGAFIGAVSGFFGGWVDVVIQRFIELLRSFPRIPLWLALALILPPTWPSTWVYMGIVVVLSFIGWMGVARVVRGIVLSLREKEFILAAQVMGQRRVKTIFAHIFPNITTYLIVVSTLSIPAMILGESAISFLGLGIKEPMTSWGLLLQQAQSISAISSYPWLMIPGIFIMLSVLSFNFLGDAIRDALDPFGEVKL